MPELIYFGYLSLPVWMAVAYRCSFTDVLWAKSLKYISTLFVLVIVLAIGSRNYGGVDWGNYIASFKDAAALNLNFLIEPGGKLLYFLDGISIAHPIYLTFFVPALIWVLIFLWHLNTNTGLVRFSSLIIVAPFLSGLLINIPRNAASLGILYISIMHFFLNRDLKNPLFWALLFLAFSFHNSVAPVILAVFFLVASKYLFKEQIIDVNLLIMMIKVRGKQFLLAAILVGAFAQHFYSDYLLVAYQSLTAGVVTKVFLIFILCLIACICKPHDDFVIIQVLVCLCLSICTVWVAPGAVARFFYVYLVIFSVLCFADRPGLANGVSLTFLGLIVTAVALFFYVSPLSPSVLKMQWGF